MVTTATPGDTMFAYDAKAPLGLRVLSTEHRPGVTVEEISYGSPQGGPVPAVLVIPDGRGPFAGIVYMHWGLGDRHAFVEEAVAMAARGAVSLLVESPLVRAAPWRMQGELYDAALVRCVVELRRGIDLLLARADVDAQRLAYVGHSWGAHTGGLLAGVERRLGAYVLMGGFASLSDNIAADAAYRKEKGEAAVDTLLARLRPLDAERWVARAAPAKLFFQFAFADQYISQAQAARYYAAASEPKLWKWYDGGHELTGYAARDRADWLATVIGTAPAQAGRDRALRLPDAWRPELESIPSVEQAKPGEVLAVPGMEEVRTRGGIPFAREGDRQLTFTVYYPPQSAPGERPPAVILVAGQAHPAHLREMQRFRPAVTQAELVAAGARVAAITYDVRSAAEGARPEQWYADLPAVARDLDDLVAYLRGHAAELGIDGERLALWTRSYGWPYGVRAGLAEDSPFVKALVAFYPEVTSEVLAHTEPPLPQAFLEQASLLAQLRRRGKDLPPLLLVTAGHSASFREGEVAQLEREAQRLGAPLEHLHLAEGHDGFDLFDDCEASRDALRRALSFLRERLGVP
ncbi:MAG TPA: hypothetical protein VGV61_19550 [Thermoanaerobaculia bacterium]|nr:hypothetical protein [Thermoanaerobaculia bacterium]